MVSNVRVTVHLLNTANIPGHHYRTVEVQIDNTESLEGKFMLFSPQQDKEDWSGILATSFVCCVNGKDKLDLTVENHNLNPITV